MDKIYKDYEDKYVQYTVFYVNEATKDQNGTLIPKDDAIYTDASLTKKASANEVRNALHKGARFCGVTMTSGGAAYSMAMPIKWSRIDEKNQWVQILNQSPWPNGTIFQYKATDN